MQKKAVSVPNVPGAKGMYPIGPSVAICFNNPCIAARIVTLTENALQWRLLILKDALLFERVNGQGQPFRRERVGIETYH